MVELLVVPNARCSSTVGHYYLDLVEKNGGALSPSKVDGRSETGELYVAHIAFQHCIPDILFEDIPSFVACKSTDNIPIESLWHLFTNYVGPDIEQIILVGKSLNYFHPGLQLHIDLFNCLWPKIIRLSLDDFVEYWDNHKVRTQ
ncbi:hypothetical protein DFH09DRAFT_858973, partial [Mycena vulgaris]